MDAMGGTAKFETIHSYAETRHPIGDRSAAIITKSVRMPDFCRDETVMGANKFGTLITPDYVFRLFRDEGIGMPKSFSNAVRADWKREFLPILLNRNAKDSMFIS